MQEKRKTKLAVCGAIKAPNDPTEHDTHNYKSFLITEKCNQMCMRKILPNNLLYKFLLSYINFTLPSIIKIYAN